ncbi:MAG TPA: nitrogenase component 1, partial [Desulfobacteria bacterium]|nr:nitrogenase component 1 [Desulfobacteria bacterium]
VIGDDLEAVCKAAGQRHGIRIIPVQSSGFIGNKAAGYRAACDALLKLLKADGSTDKVSKSVNYMGDFNLAGEIWIIKRYLNVIGINVNSTFTGDASYETLKKAPGASLNIIQCAGSMTYLAQQLAQIYGIPYLRVSFLGVQDTCESLRNIAKAFNDPEIMWKTEELIARETAKIQPIIESYRAQLSGKKAAVFVGGGFKAISLLKQFRELGMDVVMVGTQNGKQDEYATINDLASDGTVILDDANPAELEKFMLEKGAHLLVGGVKERPLAYKLGVAFIDHNHDRKHPLSGFVGAVNFAREVHATLCSPVWKYVGRERP